MDMLELQPDFKEFLKLLNSHRVKYLLIGGYAVCYYGYPRSTGDMDIWIAIDSPNAENIANAVREFGMPQEQVSQELFMQEEKIIRMGLPPVRIELITGISGVHFDECYSRKGTIESEGLTIDIIGLEDLKKNKRSAARFKDLEDLKHLP